jgi:hypothetical protein
MPTRIYSWSLISLMALLFGCASPGTGTKSAVTQRMPAPAKVTRTGGTEVHPAPLSSANNDTGFHGLSLANFSQRIVGGQVIESGTGQIVVEAKSAKPSTDPVALTNDAIITTSIRARIAQEPKLKSADFQVTSSDGVVSIRAQQDSLDDALSVINLTLTVPDVREVVYLLPTRV